MKSPVRFACLLMVLFTSFSIVAQDKPDALRLYRQGRDLESAGRAAEANQRYDEAIAVCREELAQSPSNMDSYVVLTWSLRRQEKFRETVEWCQKGLKVNGGEHRLIETLGEALFYLNEFKESLKAMQRYVDAAPQGERASVAYFFMGEVYRIQKKFMHADMAYSMAIKLEPSMPLWWLRLGQVRESNNDFKNAAAAYQKAIELRPAYKEAQEGLDRAKRRLS